MTIKDRRCFKSTLSAPLRSMLFSSFLLGLYSLSNLFSSEKLHDSSSNTTRYSYSLNRQLTPPPPLSQSPTPPLTLRSSSGTNTTTPTPRDLDNTAKMVVKAYVIYNDVHTPNACYHPPSTLINPSPSPQVLPGGREPYPLHLPG